MPQHSQRAKRTERDQIQRRTKIREESARILCEEGVRDFYFAKRKACNRLMYNNMANLPSNLEIEQALISRLQLFKGDTLRKDLRVYYDIARELMNWLNVFTPRLSGSLARGYIIDASAIEIHLFAEPIELVMNYIRHRQVAATLGQQKIRYQKKQDIDIAQIQFFWKEITIECAVFRPHQLRQAPLCPIARQPMLRLSLKQLPVVY